MIGWNIHPKQFVAQLFGKDKCFIVLMSYIMSLILLCISNVNEIDLYVVLMIY
jgi:hypothetical protein